MATKTEIITASGTSLTSKWTWSESSNNGTIVTYKVNSGPSGASVLIAFDLTSIPANAIIKSAILSVSITRSNSTGGFTSHPSITSNHNIGGINASGTGTKMLDITNAIEPGKVNDVNFYYKASLNSATINSSDGSVSGLSCSSRATYSNLQLTVAYEIPGTMKYYDGSEWKACTCYYHNGFGWVEVTPYYYDGSEWKECIVD